MRTLWISANIVVTYIMVCRRFDLSYHWAEDLLGRASCALSVHHLIAQSDRWQSTFYYDCRWMKSTTVQFRHRPLLFSRNSFARFSLISLVRSVVISWLLTAPFVNPAAAQPNWCLSVDRSSSNLDQ